MTDWFRVGKITKPHGLNGEVRVISMTDFPDERFSKGNKLYLDQGNQEEPLPLVIAARRKHKQFELLRFKGYDHISHVEKWKGAVLKVPGDQLADLDEDEYYYHDIIGCQVVTEEGEQLGKIREILSTGANDIWIVKGTRPKEILIPYIEDVVKKVDVENKIVTIHVMEGLLE